MREPCASCEASVAIRLVDFVPAKFCAECPFGYVPTRFSRIRVAMAGQRQLRIYSCRRIAADVPRPTLDG